MKDYTNKIEKYLRGQMSQEDEEHFKNDVRLKKHICFQAYLTTLLMKTYRKGT